MKKKLTILLLLLVMLSGCTKRFTIENKEDKTTKSYVSNILCKPEKEDLIEIYKSNEKKLIVKYDKLPKCKDMKINSGGYEGLWTSIFVKPLAWIIVKLATVVKNYGVSIMIIGVLLRLAMYPLSKKSTNMSANMNKAKGDLDRLEKKYKDKTDKESMMAKSQEMMLIYKKYDISPISGCLVSFLQLPLFFAFYEAIYRVPTLFEDNLWKFQLGTTPTEAFAAGNYYYIILIVLIIGATYFSFKNMNVSSDPVQAKQMKTMSIFMVAFISIASFSLPAGVALYWIVSNGFTVVQNILLKKGSL